MRFDSNEAWKAATAAVAANRDMLLAIAGVFMLLPAFAVMVFLPEPPVAGDAQPEDMLAAYSAYFVSAWPWMAGMLVLQLIGTLAMLALVTDPARPTVGQALRQGLAATPTAAAAMIVLLFALSFVASLPLSLAAPTGSAGLSAAGMAAGLAIMLYGLARTLPVLPVIQHEGLRNPFTALRRTFALTRGNGARLLLFYALIFVAFFLVRQLLLAGLAIAVGLLLDEGAADLVVALVAATVDAVMAAYMAAVLAAIHRQLAAPASPFQP